MNGLADDDLSDLCLTAARAGSAAVRQFSPGNITIDTKSSPSDYVTSADRAAEAAILAVIKSTRPDDSILAEESRPYVGTTPVRWVVDPLDGTANFVHGRREYATAVGVEIDGRAVAGAIVRHSDGSWVVGGPSGAYTGRADSSTERQAMVCDDHARAPRLIQLVQAEKALVSIGLPSLSNDRTQALRIVTSLVSSIGAVRIQGSAACDFVGLIKQECNAYLAIKLAKWDTAAGEAIVLAAGGTIRKFEHASGLPIVIAGPNVIVNELERLVQERDREAEPRGG